MTPLTITKRAARYLLGTALLWVVLTFSATAEFYAAQVSAQNAHRLPEAGMDGIGGIDDWFLTNGELCAIISSKSHASYLSGHGGVLVDLWNCDLANDQWSSNHPQFNLQKDQIPATQDIKAGHSEAQSWIETLAKREGLEARTRYSLSAEKPGQLDIETRIRRLSVGESLGMFGSLILHPRGSLTPFTLDTEAGEYSRGANQPSINTADQSSILFSVVVADLQILLGSKHIAPSITYGVQNAGAVLQDANGTEAPLHQFLLGGQDFSLFGAFTGPFPSWWSRTPGMVSFLGGLLFDLDVGETFILQQSVLVARGSSAAGITDRLYSGPSVSGTLDTHNAGITVKDTQGKAITFLRPDKDGGFSFRIPAGAENVTLSIETPWGKQTVSTPITQPNVHLGAITTGAIGTLRLPQSEVMNLVFEAKHFRPIFNHELVSGQLGGERALSGPESYRISLAGTTKDLREVQLPPGQYRILASRGPEFSVTETSVNITAGEITDLAISRPKRVLDTSGLVSADFHLHSGLSFDSSLSPEQRVIDFVAQGCEILVPTEHFVTYDLRSTISALGLENDVISFPGVEITGMARTAIAPTTIGHSNVFPVEADPSAFMGGTLPFENKRLGQVIGEYKALFPDSIFQLNHPRDVAMDDDIAFFNHLSQGAAYDPQKLLTEEPNSLLIEKHQGSSYRDIDFDVLELLNSKDMALYELTRTDWFSFLRQNIYHVVTANSDSHMSSQLVAYPRNMLAIPHSRLADISTADIVRTVKAGNVYGTTGPMLQIDLDGIPPGGTFTGTKGILSIMVDSADWIPVDEARIWLNGELHNTLPLTVGTPLRVEIDVDSDSFIFVEVAGPASETYKAVAPGYRPFAFANPIFVDTFADGWRFGESSSH